MWRAHKSRVFSPACIILNLKKHQRTVNLALPWMWCYAIADGPEYSLRLPWQFSDTHLYTWVEKFSEAVLLKSNRAGTSLKWKLVRRNIVKNRLMSLPAWASCIASQFQSNTEEDCSISSPREDVVFLTFEYSSVSGTILCKGDGFNGSNNCGAGVCFRYVHWKCCTSFIPEF